MNSFTFNLDNGFLEGIVRGFKAGILKGPDYINLTQCENLDDLKQHLQSTDYGDFLNNEQGPLTVLAIDSKLTEKLVIEFNYLRNNSLQPLSQFLEYITYGYMIDNIILLISGTLRGRSIKELLPKCNPLGHFEQMEALGIASTSEELYDAILVDTPLANYFGEWLSHKDLDELNIEIIRNTLYKAYIDDFYNFCKGLGSATEEIMCEILGFEADRRAFIITINSFETDLSTDDRNKLYSKCGKLYPDGLEALSKAEDIEQVKEVAQKYAEYNFIFKDYGSVGDGKSIEDRFFEKEIELMKKAFMNQFHYGVFYAYFKMKEQESRNIIWIAECIVHSNRSKMENYIPIY